MLCPFSRVRSVGSPHPVYPLVLGPESGTWCESYLMVRALHTFNLRVVGYSCNVCATLEPGGTFCQASDHCQSDYNCIREIGYCFLFQYQHSTF